VLTVRRIGFEAATFTAVLRAGKTHRATFPLSAAVVSLPKVAVQDSNPSHWLDSFEKRRAHERGPFITRKDIERRSARNGTELIRTIPGIRVQPGPFNSGTVIMTRAAGASRCLPQIYVHGTPYSGTMDDFTAEDIEAIEVYVGISEIPPEFNRSTRQGRGFTSPCAVIVVWTRDPARKP
jgi:outer membrane receptor for ferrienterochelin and colicin